MEIKSINPNLRQDQIAKELGCSSSTLKRYGNDIKKLKPYRGSTKSHKMRKKISNTNLDDNSNREHGLKMTSNDPKRPQNIEDVKLVSNAVSTNKKNKLKSGSLKENHEMNGEISDEIFHNKKPLIGISNANYL